MRGLRLGTLLCCGLAAGLPTLGAESPRETISLDGTWLFRRDEPADGAWKEVEVPSSFETHEGEEFDGIGWYRRSVAPFPLPDGKRAILHFQAAATDAVVWWNDKELGSHLGAWTPFRFDVTELVRASPPGERHEIRVRLDEKVGHNTQGFLPIIAPHFGGLWQGVTLLIVPETYIEDLGVKAVGDPEDRRILLEIPLRGTAAEKVSEVTLRYRLRDSGLRGGGPWASTRMSFFGWSIDAKSGRDGEDSDWKVEMGDAPAALPLSRREGSTIHAHLDVPAPRLWSPGTPDLYEVEIELPGERGRTGDVVRTRAAFRAIEAVGRQLRLNGKPLSVRGVLNWGYYPPGTAPTPAEETIRRDIEIARARGFNLMKFCLWVPPSRYLEIADEMGFLTWMEYPTWHPQLTKKHLEPLRQEFTEFFLYDRNHPSVILRSLTCETGASADIDVIRDLYDRAHALIPGALVEDDSSWIGWNRIHDFYDDHPYGNNHTWVATLESLDEHILAHGPKPLLLGEAMAADTWVEREPLAGVVGDRRPFWVPGFYDDARRWVATMRGLHGPHGLEGLRDESLKYAHLMRKYQVETYRREIPYGGYVISVLRDFSLASMGLLDYVDRPKWTPEDWEWHGDTLCLLATQADRRSFPSGGRLTGDVLVSHFGPEHLESGELRVFLEDPQDSGEPPAAVRKEVDQNPGTLAKVLSLDFPLPRVSSPRRVVVWASLRAGSKEVRNHWPLWIVPAVEISDRPGLWLHPSVPSEVAAALFPGAPRLGSGVPVAGVNEGVVVASRFDDALVRILESGGKVLLLPDGEKKSLPLAAHWFLRGGPYVPRHPVSKMVPRDMLVELQHFDLGASVVPDIGYLDAIDPILLLWDTHDLKRVKTHGLIFETRAPGGRLLVSTVRHGTPENAAGRWLLGALLDHLRTGPAPQRSLSDATWRHLVEKLHEERVDLTSKVWLFRPEPPGADMTEEWAFPSMERDDGWKEIRIGSAWESQGYPALDGWAWYRLSVRIPAGWRDRRVYLTFEGVDDLYELHVGGRLVAKRGDLETRKDTFSERWSHDISAYVTPGEDCLLAVRVHDWYGAGGIFRPVTLGTAPLRPDLEFLR